MRVSEIFGPTFQGEGASVGRQAVFVRLWGCNLDCAWCDTPYTWDVTGKNGTVYSKEAESSEISVADIVDQVDRIAGQAQLVVITGGEPLIQTSELVNLVTVLVACGYRVEIETNGTRPPLTPEISGAVTYNVSPKLFHARTSKQSIRADVLRQFRQQCSIFKFVVTDTVDLAEVEAVVEAVEIPAHRVWIMPEGRTEAQLAERAGIIQGVLDRGWNYSTRLHVLLWGDKRGV